MTEYWVSANYGSDGNNGTSSNSPFATLQQAANQTQPGDTVEIMDGTYTNPGYGQDVLSIRHGGYAGAPITFEAAPGAHPVIQFANGNGISVWGSNYVTIQGLDIEGNANSISQDYANSQSGNSGNPTTNSSGIAIEGNGNHITVQNNTLANAPGAGVYADGVDYVNISNNTVYGNAHWSVFGFSGISVSHAQSSDGNTGTKDYIDNNTVYDNAQYVPNLTVGHIADGNGIIVDDNRNTQTNNNVYNGRTDVSGNLSYDNGGNGISVYSDVNVDVYNNTAYGNATVVPGYTDIGINGNDGGNVYNNNAGASAGASQGASQSASQSSSQGSSDQDLVVTVGADSWQGDPQFIVSVDGTQQGGTYSTSAQQSQGQTQDFTFQNLSPGSHDVAITFLNDAYGGSSSMDRNLYVDSLTYAGQQYNDTATMSWNGTVHFTVGS